MLITGTRRGIGQAMAHHYLEAGWRVVGCSRKSHLWEHPHYVHFTLDVGDEKAVVAMMRSVARQYDTLDVLLNNAGIASMNHVLLSPGSTARRIFETNVLGSFYCLREAAKLMRKNKGGKIVNFSTVAVPLRLEGEALYAASKAAIESMTRITARELGPLGITVNAVGPTPVDPDLIKGVPKEKMDALLRQQAIPRFGTPEDILNVIDFFLRPESDFITGQVIYLGGVA